MDKVLILGATGRTGKLLLDEALTQGYSVTVLVRDPEKVAKREHLTIYQGTPTTIDDLSKALTGCSYVLSALNISRNSDFPWASLRTPKDFISQTIKNVIALAKTNPVKQFVGISAWGVSETKEDIPFWFRWTINLSNIKYGYIEHENQERLLAESDLNWTIVRPTGLTNSKIPRTLIVSYDNKPKPKLLVSRSNLAKFVVDVLDRPLFYRRKVTLSEYWDVKRNTASL